MDLIEDQNKAEQQFNDMSHEILNKSCKYMNTFENKPIKFKKNNENLNKSLDGINKKNLTLKLSDDD